MNENRLYSILSDFEGGHTDLHKTADLILKNIPSSNRADPKCYEYNNSDGCPAIWHDKCTSTKYADCGVK
ncbi:hypothetical protein KAH94_05015 [bacterium]|nr:hypothetical protein [bacterium]